MVAHEFFSRVEQYCNSGCSNIRITAEGTPITTLQYNGFNITTPEELLMLKDVYLSDGGYMYARFGTGHEMVIVDTNARQLGDLKVDDVSQDDNTIVIEVKFVGTE